MAECELWVLQRKEECVLLEHSGRSRTFSRPLQVLETTPDRSSALGDWEHWPSAASFLSPFEYLRYPHTHTHLRLKMKIVHEMKTQLKGLLAVAVDL